MSRVTRVTPGAGPAARQPGRGQMTGYTRLVLTGRSLIAVGSVTELARPAARRRGA